MSNENEKANGTTSDSTSGTLESPDEQGTRSDEPAVHTVPQPQPGKEKIEEREPHEFPFISNIIVLRYEGEKHGELFHGEGVAYFEGGSVYKGTFAEGFMHGYGQYTWANGVKYEGNFTLNVPMGSGNYTWLDGSSYEGEIHYGIRHGTGTYTFAKSSAVYRGQWYQGKRHGKGTIYYNEELTSWYEGDWLNNLKEGWGVRHYPSGNIYEGQWKGNVRHGKGKMRWVQLGQQYSGEWVDGIQHGRGTHTWFMRRVPGSQYPLRNEYKGDFVWGQRHGQGMFFYSSGAMYSGGWKLDQKHGQGKFIFKNGRIFEGEFINDRMAEFPAFSIDCTRFSNLSGIRLQTPAPYKGDVPTKAQKSGGNVSLLGPDLALNIQTLLNRIHETKWEQELRQVESVIIRHIGLLRVLYSLYSRLGHDHSPDNTFILTRLQFWRFLKDCGVDQHGITLAQMDHLFVDENMFEPRGTQHEDFLPEENHSPFCTMLLRQCISCLVIAAYHIYHNDIVSSSSLLAECLSMLMNQNVIPNAKNVKGPVFCHPLRAVVGMKYINKCWEIFQVFSKANTAVSSRQTITARQFIWMLKDFGLFDSKLSTARVLEFLSLGDSAVCSATHSTLELEITFLEFFEALISCAEVKMTQEDRTAETTSEPDYQDKTVNTASEEINDTFFQSNSKRSSPQLRPDVQVFKMNALTQSSSTEEMEQNPNEADEALGPEADLEAWICRTHQFFTQIFFPAYKHTLLVKEEIKEEQLRLNNHNRDITEKATDRPTEQCETEEDEKSSEELLED